MPEPGKLLKLRWLRRLLRAFERRQDPRRERLVHLLDVEDLARRRERLVHLLADVDEEIEDIGAEDPGLYAKWLVELGHQRARLVAQIDALADAPNATALQDANTPPNPTRDTWGWPE